MKFWPEKQANKFREIQEGNRKWFPEDYDFGKEAEKTYSRFD